MNNDLDITRDEQMVLAREHTHREAGQVLRHAHSGSDRTHGYFEHHEDGCHVTCDHEQPAERVVTVYDLPGTSPTVAIGITDQATVLIGERLGTSPAAVNWISRTAGHAALAGIQQVFEAVMAEQKIIDRQLHPGELRLALHRALQDGPKTIAYLTELMAMNQIPALWGVQLRDELAAMRDDGEVEFDGPRYRLIENG